MITERRREYLRNYQRQWMRKRRAGFLEDKACKVCGSKEELQLDHIDRTKKTSHNIWSWKGERREAEIAKCQILCRKHHQEKTNRDFKRGPEFLVHGKVQTYRVYKCRCELCRQALRDSKPHAARDRRARERREARIEAKKRA